jgi:hypothetical protein
MMAIGTSPALKTEVRPSDMGRYIYGVAARHVEIRLGPVGIEEREVYTIPWGRICAVVHNCPTVPYRSADEETVKQWVKTHQDVLDLAGKFLGTVIPLGFDTILEPRDDAASPEQVVKDWLRQDYTRIHEVMRKIEGKNEYAVQISYESELIVKQISEKSEEVKKIKEEMAIKPPGMAYMYRQKLERVVKAETERFADERFKDIYGRIKKNTDDIVIEKNRKPNGSQVMLLNLSCLVARGKVDSLGRELEGINNTGSFSVHFSGPWPPYSFVAKPVVIVKGK